MYEPPDEMLNALFAIPKEEVLENPLYRLLRGIGKPLGERLRSPRGVHQTISLSAYAITFFMMSEFAWTYLYLSFLFSIFIINYHEKSLFTRYRDDGLFKELHLTGNSPSLILESFRRGLALGYVGNGILLLMFSLAIIRAWPTLTLDFLAFIVTVSLLLFIWYCLKYYRTRDLFIVQRDQVMHLLALSQDKTTLLASIIDIIVIGGFIISLASANSKLLIFSMVMVLVITQLKRKSRIFEQERYLKTASPQQVEELLVKVFMGETIK